MTKVVTAIVLNRDTCDGEGTCRAALLVAPTDEQKRAIPRSASSKRLTRLRASMIAAIILPTILLGLACPCDPLCSLIIDSTSITAAAECGPNNHWTCAIAAAVFLFA